MSYLACYHKACTPVQLEISTLCLVRLEKQTKISPSISSFVACRCNVEKVAEERQLVVLGCILFLHIMMPFFFPLKDAYRLAIQRNDQNPTCLQ